MSARRHAALLAMVLWAVCAMPAARVKNKR